MKIKYNFNMLFPIIGFAILGLMLVGAFYGIGFRVDEKIVDFNHTGNYPNYDPEIISNQILIKLSDLKINLIGISNNKAYVLANDIHNLGAAAIAIAFLGMLIPFGLGFIENKKITAIYRNMMAFLVLTVFVLALASSIQFLVKINDLFPIRMSEYQDITYKADLGSFIGFFILIGFGFITSTILVMKTQTVKIKKEKVLV